MLALKPALRKLLDEDQVSPNDGYETVEAMLRKLGLVPNLGLVDRAVQQQVWNEIAARAREELKSAREEGLKREQ
jgi:hypothetical protein